MGSLGWIGICLLGLVGALGTAAAPSTPADWVRWFADDFEDGTVRRWRLWGLNTNLPQPGSWAVVKDGGNNVFADRLESFASPKTVRGSDYRLKVKAKVIRGSLHAGIHENAILYFVGLYGNGLSLMRIHPKGVLTTLRSVSEIHQPDRWYVLEIVAIGPDINVYLDDVLKISYSDPNSISVGGAMLWTPGNSEVQVDDVEITGPPQSGSDLRVADVDLPNPVAGAPYTHTLTALGGTPPYEWSPLAGSGMPAGLSLNADGTISGTLAKTGTYPITIAVTDAQGNRAIEGLHVSVDEAAITTNAMLPVAEVGTPYSARFEGIGLPRGCQWLATELPPGMALDPVSGVLSGTPALAGNYRPVVVCISSGDPPAKAFGFYAAEPNRAPLAIVTRPETLWGVELRNHSTGTLLAAAGGLPPYSWSITSGELPSGMRLLAGRLLSEGSPFQAMIGGFPMSDGKYRVTVEVADSAGAKASQEFVVQTTWINVDGDDNYDNMMLLTMGAPYSTQLSAEGGIGPYRWASLSLPEGLNLTPEGKLSGVPSECGMLPFLAQVTDSDNVPVTHRFGAEFFIMCAKGSFSLVSIHAPAEITGAKMNEPFQYPIGLGNGTGKGYSCSLSSGALPGGLTLIDGKLPAVVMISGTPAEAGTFAFELRATDDGGNIGVRKLKLVVQ